MSPRDYKMQKRAEAQEQTRERILKATMELHDEKGVGPTSLADVAERAGLGVATVYRYFPTVGALVSACGGHVWQEMRPPSAESAVVLFAGVKGRHARLALLVAELDSFYARSSYRLIIAARDREQVPELEVFLKAIAASVEALVREALRPENLSEASIAVVIALCHVSNWVRLNAIPVPPAELPGLKVRLLSGSIAAGVPRND